jgi:hypothetical protein
MRIRLIRRDKKPQGLQVMDIEIIIAERFAETKVCYMDQEPF